MSWVVCPVLIQRPRYAEEKSYPTALCNDKPEEPLLLKMLPSLEIHGYSVQSILDIPNVQTNNRINKHSKGMHEHSDDTTEDSSSNLCNY